MRGPRLALLCLLAIATPAVAEPPVLERVSTVAPFPRGLAVVDGEMLVLCRGRVRGAGGVTAEIDDQAGTIYAIDPSIAEPARGVPGEAMRKNGRLVARPTAPPFRLWNRAAHPPQSDAETDRPYCTLRYHRPTHSLYLCAFSGIDMNASAEEPVAFSKNRTDAILRYDLRTGRWSEVDRHRRDAGARYPHHDPFTAPPPHGWLEGPDNCLPLGDWLYAVSKENSLLVRYDLRPLRDDPEAGPIPSYLILDHRVRLRGCGEQELLGHSMLAYHDGWLYIGLRTSSVIVRIPLDEVFLPRRPITAELVARFDPHDAVTHTSADLTDMAFDEGGRLHVISAQPARVYRFTPDPDRVFDARNRRAPPWADLAAMTGNPRMKSENVLCHAGYVYVTAGDGYAYQDGADGTVYRISIRP